MAERRQEEKKSDRRINPRTRPSLGADSEGAEEMHPLHVDSHDGGQRDDWLEGRFGETMAG
jgi:hypothetical protein